MVERAKARQFGAGSIAPMGVIRDQLDTGKSAFDFSEVREVQTETGRALRPQEFPTLASWSQADDEGQGGE